MKQLFVLFLLSLCTVAASAQDVIVKKDGSTILCRVVEVSSSEIIYKRWSDLDGSNYVMNRTDASVINYESGKRENLGEIINNLYAPNNQNSGTQMLNDQALLSMNAANRIEKKAKTLKTIGWIGGGTILVGTGIVMLTASVRDDTFAGKYQGLIWAASGAASVAWTTAFLLAANSYEKQATQQQFMSLWEEEIKFKNGSSLHAGIDVLQDNIIGNSTVGLGLRYNF